MKKQYIVQESNKEKREEFYEYIINNYDLFVESSKDYMIESNFPFVVDFKENNFWICNSVTCCACAAQKGKIIDVKKFKERVR